jgi:hypothetical protein
MISGQLLQALLAEQIGPTVAHVSHQRSPIANQRQHDRRSHSSKPGSVFTFVPKLVVQLSQRRKDLLHRFAVVQTIHAFQSLAEQARQAIHDDFRGQFTVGHSACPIGNQVKALFRVGVPMVLIPFTDAAPVGLTCMDDRVARKSQHVLPL